MGLSIKNEPTSLCFTTVFSALPCIIVLMIMFLSNLKRTTYKNGTTGLGTKKKNGTVLLVTAKRSNLGNNGQKPYLYNSSTFRISPTRWALCSTTSCF